LQSISIESKKVSPNKILCVGRNYLAHINELNNEIPEDMVLFFKPNSSIASELKSEHKTGNRTAADPEDAIHYETEICFIYAQNSLSAVGIGLDLTKRALQSKLKAKGLPWERAKAFDGAAVFSDFVTIDEVSEQLSISLLIDGQLTQSAHISQMIYSPEQILEEIKKFVTLEDGDIIMTGTPAGVGQVQRDSVFKAELHCADRLLVRAQWQAK